MVCPEKTRLQNVFAAAIGSHAKMMKSLHSTKGTAFSKVLKEAELARQEAEIARLAVEEHRLIHGCD